MLAYCQSDSWEQISVKFESEFYHFHSRKRIWNYRLPKWRPFCPGRDELTWVVHARDKHWQCHSSKHWLFPPYLGRRSSACIIYRVNHTSLGVKHVRWVLLDDTKQKNITVMILLHIIHFSTTQTFSCDQVALWMVQPARPSVCLSHIFRYVPLIVSSWSFQELSPLAEVVSMFRSEVKGQGHIDQNPILPFPDRNSSLSLMWHRRCVLLFFNVIRQISRSHGATKSPNLTRIERNSSLNWPMARKWGTKLKVTGQKIANFDLNRAFPVCNMTPVQFTDGFEIMHRAWSSLEEVPYCFSMWSI